MLTEIVHLTEGIAIDGRRFKAVLLRAPMVKDSLDVEKESEHKGILYTSIALIIKSIVEVGAMDKAGTWSEKVPMEKVTVDAVGTLNEEDLERLQVARDFLKKKHTWQRTD
jgi:phage FluMu protein gp41